MSGLSKGKGGNHSLLSDAIKQDPSLIGLPSPHMYSYSEISFCDVWEMKQCATLQSFLFYAEHGKYPRRAAPIYPFVVADIIIHYRHESYVVEIKEAFDKKNALRNRITMMRKKFLNEAFFINQNFQEPTTYIGVLNIHAEEREIVNFQHFRFDESEKKIVSKGEKSEISQDKLDRILV